MLKWLLKWGLRAFLLAVVLVVIFFLSLDSIFKAVIEHRIHQQLGMQVEIGKFHLGLTEPVMEIKNLQIYNSPQFGGTPFINIPEIYVEYDPVALKNKEIHLTLLRFNLGELDVVKSQDGLTNIFSMGVALPTKMPSGPDTNNQLSQIKEQTGFDFKGIDCLNVSVGSLKYVDLQNQTNSREQKLAIDNCVITNVTSIADLTGLGLLVGLRSGDFFKSLVEPDASKPGQSTQDLLKLLGR